MPLLLAQLPFDRAPASMPLPRVADARPALGSHTFLTPALQCCSKGPGTHRLWDGLVTDRKPGQAAFRLQVENRLLVRMARCNAELAGQKPSG